MGVFLKSLQTDKIQVYSKIKNLPFELRNLKENENQLTKNSFNQELTVRTNINIQNCHG